MARAALLLGLLWLCASAVFFQTQNHVDQSEREKPVFVGDQVRDTEIAVNASLRLFRSVKQRIPLLPASIMALCGALLCGYALANKVLIFPFPAAGQLQPRHNQWGLLAVGVLALGILADSNGQVTQHIPRLNQHLQYALLCLGVIFVALGVGNFNAPPSEETPPHPWRLILALSLVGLMLRLWHLDRLRVMVDELPFTEAVFTLSRDPRLGLLTRISNVFPFPHLFPYWVQTSTNVLGGSYAAIRVPNAIAGGLTLPATYLLADRLFNRRVALLSLILLLSFPPHLHFSRLSMLHVFDTLAGVCAFAFALQGIRTRHRMNFALSGVALGFTQYFYEGGRLLFPAVMLVWGAVLLWQHRSAWRGLGWMWFTAVIVASPVYYTLYGNAESSAQRLETVGLTRAYWSRFFQASPDDPILQAQFDRSLNPVLHYFSVPDMSVFYSGQTPLLLVFLVPFFMVGIVYLLSHWQHPASALLLAWLCGTAFGSSLLVESGVTARFVEVFPALILTSALGLWASLEGLIPNARQSWRVMSSLALMFALLQGFYYFDIHLDKFDYEIRHIKPYPDGEDALLHFMERDYHQGTRLILISDPPTPTGYLSQILLLLSPDQHYPFDAHHPYTLTDDYLRNLQNGFDIAFFMRPEDEYSRSLVEQYFDLEAPRRSPHHEQIPDDRELWLYFAPAFTLESAEPIEWEAD